MKRYISKAERDQIVTLDALVGTLVHRVIPNADKMGKEIAKRFKTAKTNLTKALDLYLASISPEDEAKLRFESSRSRIILASNAYTPKQDVDERMQIMWELADHAIGNTCRGCKRDPNTCELRKVLIKADVPYTTTEPVNCAYELPEVDV